MSPVSIDHWQLEDIQQGLVHVGEAFFVAVLCPVLRPDLIAPGPAKDNACLINQRGVIRTP